MATTELAASVQALFQRFSDADHRMTCAQALEFARSCGLLGLDLGAADVDLNFHKIKLAGRRSIAAPQFTELLRQLAIRKGCALAEFVAQAEAACPALLPTPPSQPIISVRGSVAGRTAARLSQTGRSSLVSAGSGSSFAAAAAAAAAEEAVAAAEAADLAEALLGRPYFHHALGLDTINRSLNKKPVLIDLGKAVSEGDVTAMAAMVQGGGAKVGAVGADGTVVVKAGWLIKQGAMVKNWKKRWFVLRSAPGDQGGELLTYYARKEDDRALGQIVLDTNSLITGMHGVSVVSADAPRTGAAGSDADGGGGGGGSGVLSDGDGVDERPASRSGADPGGAMLLSGTDFGPDPAAASSKPGGHGGHGGHGSAKATDKRNRDFEFTIARVKSAKSKARTYRLCASSQHELMAWVDVLRSAVEGRMQTTWMEDEDEDEEGAEDGQGEGEGEGGGGGGEAGEGDAEDGDGDTLCALPGEARKHGGGAAAADDGSSGGGGGGGGPVPTFRDLWRTAGIRGFVAHFQVLKRNGRGKLQPRIFELNFLDGMLHNTWRGTARRSFSFAELASATVLDPATAERRASEQAEGDPGIQASPSGRGVSRSSAIGYGSGHAALSAAETAAAIAEELSSLNPGECALEVVLRDGARHAPWVLVLESRLCRDRLLEFLRVAVERGAAGAASVAPPALAIMTAASAAASADSGGGGGGGRDGGAAVSIAGGGAPPMSKAAKRRTARLLASHVRSLTLRCGYLARRATAEERSGPAAVKAHAFSTSVERLWMVLEDDSLRGFSSPQEASGRPWFTAEGLRGVSITKIASQSLLTVGRATFVAASPADCEVWFEALQAAAKLDDRRVQEGGGGGGVGGAGADGKAVGRELAWRRVQGAAYARVIDRLRMLLDAKPDVDATAPGSAGAKAARELGPEAAAAADAAAAAAAALEVGDGMKEGGAEALSVETMLRQLWARLWPDAEWEGVRGAKWSELGFQRGGPASDLRGSGRLGLHLLLVFVVRHRKTFDATVASQAAVEAEGRLLSYPVTTACINVAALMVEVFGLGDSGSRTGGSSAAAAQGFAALVCRLLDSDGGRAVAEFAFEEAFAIFVPLLDRVFLELEAGYMEFMSCLAVLKGLMERTFASQPRTLDHMAALAEGCFIDWQQRRSRINSSDLGAGR